MEICDVLGELILFGSVGALLLSSYLNKNGHSKAGSILESLAVPIIGIGLAKYKGVIKSQIEIAAGMNKNQSYLSPKHTNYIDEAANLVIESIASL